MLYIPNSTKGN